MNINTIRLDRPAGPNATDASPTADGSFQAAYARVVGENSVPVARASSLSGLAARNYRSMLMS